MRDTILSTATRGSQAVLAGFLLTTGSGCLVATPIAIFPAPELGSGMEITFYDSLARPISQDGLLLVHREYQIPWGWTLLDLGMSNRVVPITAGKATLPHQWNLASVWLMPNMFSFFLIPMPCVLPGENLDIVPFLVGYNYHCCASHSGIQTRDTYGRIHPSTIPHYCFNDGRVYLSSSDADPERGIEYLKAYRAPYLRRPSQIRGIGDRPDLCLPESEYQRVTSFINRELERLRAIPPRGTQPSVPVDEHKH